MPKAEGEVSPTINCNVAPSPILLRAPTPNWILSFAAPAPLTSPNKLGAAVAVDALKDEKTKKPAAAGVLLAPEWNTGNNVLEAVVDALFGKIIR